jgi:transposase
VPAQWKVIATVREKWTCRQCEAITQPPAPSHPIARGRAGPQLLADVLFGKYGAHLPLNRQSEIYAREGVELDVSTLADWVGACAATLMPLRDVIEAHVHAAERIHVDDTTVPVLAKGQCRTGRLWAHVRDDRPFAGKASPAVVLYYSPNREGEHPQRQLAKYTGIMQVDAYSGYNALYADGRKPGPIVEAACWAHGRRKLYELARFAKMPIAIGPYVGSTSCSPSSATSTVWHRSNGCASGISDQSRSPRTSNARSGPSGASCPPRTHWPRRWITA